MLTKETHDLIQQLYADGIPKLRIANQLKLTHKTVNKHIKNPIWKPYTRANAVQGDNENECDGFSRKQISIAEYERRSMKSRTGCT